MKNIYNSIYCFIAFKTLILLFVAAPGVTAQIASDFNLWGDTIYESETTAIPAFEINGTLNSRASANIDPQLVAAFEAVIENHLETFNLVGISASVILPDGNVWEGAVGNSTEIEPLTPDHTLGIGSITKSFTAATILKLREEGLISLDDTIGTWIQGIENIPGDITVLQLLNHTSGLYNYTSSAQWELAIFTNLDSIWNPYSVLTNFVNTPDFAPGTDWEYCNTNYLIAGVIIELITGESYHDVVRDYFLNPLELESMFLAPFEDDVDPLAHLWFYHLQTSELIDFTAEYGLDSFTSTAWTAGSMFADAGDLGAWMKALVTGEVLSPESQELLMSFIPTGQGPGYNYGLGIHEFSIYGEYAIGHTGNIIYQSASMYYPDDDLAITFMTNHGPYNQYIFQVIHELRVAFEQWELSTSVSEVDGSNIWNLYPNPARSHMSLSNAENFDRISIVNVTGQEVSSIAVSKDQPTFNFSVEGIPRGMYLLNAYSDQQMITAIRFVKD